jgi:flagellar protein FliS
MTPLQANAYLSTQVKTSDRVDLVISLYQGALAYVKQAMEAQEEGNVEKRSDLIHRTSKILIALGESLDYTQDGGISGSLFGIYNFQIQQLLEANRTNDIEPLQTVKATLSILLNAWQQVAKSPEAVAIRTEDENRRNGISNGNSATQMAQPSLVMMA